MLSAYDHEGFFDEVVDAEGTLRDHYSTVVARLSQLGDEELARRQRLKDAIFRSQGITFTVYGDDEGTERTFPLDLVPRVIPPAEWAQLESGLIQRVRALNAFLDDLYCGGGRIVEDGVVDRHLVESADGYRPEVMGLSVPHGARCLVSGIDILRDAGGRYLVLEDNLRNPSGVSYVLENRSTMARVLPVAFGQSRVRSVDHYPNLLLDALRSVAPPHATDPTVVLLTPGRYNSAYFEHAFLARQMGIELVEGADLSVTDDMVWMQTTRGPRRVDVVYRRIDDTFLDPTVFRPDSLLGVPGLMGAARAGNVTVANAVGNGVADDKAVYAYVPDMIRYYLGEEPILGNVPTYLLHDPDQRALVLDRLEELVVKPVAGSGGYGLLIGPDATPAELDRIRSLIQADPRGFIAQEVVSLSRHPTLVDGGFEGRHIDLRPFVVAGEEIAVLPGGLTRVALRKGSLVVNSSQGGGSKDTWVLADGPVEEPPARRPGRRRDEVVPARVAANLFWTGRYLERVAATVRLLDVAYHGLLEDVSDAGEETLRELLDVLLLQADFDASGRPVEADEVMRFLVSDRSNPGSVISALAVAREDVRSIREKVSTELWEAINDLHLELAGRNLDAALAYYPFDVFSAVKRGCQLVAGAVDTTMSHNDGWRFLELGQVTERALVTTRLLDVYFRKLLSRSRVVAFHQWVSVLKAAGAFQEYRKIYQTSLDPGDAIGYLLLAEEFPRSVLHCVRQADAVLTVVQAPGFGQASRRHVGLLRADLEFCDLDALLEAGLARFLGDVTARLEALSDLVGHDYLGAEAPDPAGSASAQRQR